jgi:release factor glutamine methyltransferase
MMKNLGEVFNLSVYFLDQKGISRSRLIVQELMCHCLGLDKLALFMSFDKPLEEIELQNIRSGLTQVSRGKPIEQVVGVVDFYGCKIHVNEHVLIPRPETEILIDMICKGVDREGLHVWDICTGTGCLGISFKKRFPNCFVSISDISSESLKVASFNSVKNMVDVEIFQGDLFHPFQGRNADLIICNPPYISDDEYVNLDSSVKDYEPKIALTSGPTGLEFYERLSRELPSHLHSGGRVYLEIGSGQGDALLNLFSDSFWTQKKIINDWAGHNRFFFLEIE